MYDINLNSCIRSQHNIFLLFLIVKDLHYQDNLLFQLEDLT